MNTNQLRQILSQNPFTKKYFLNVFPSDQLPENIHSYPTCFVANADSTDEPGSHWLAFYLPSSHEIEFFDSYGNSPAYYEGFISNYVSRHTQVNYNPLTLQSNTTAVCGQYCIFYLYSRCRGQSLKKIVSRFITKSLCNDQRVYNFVSKRFHMHVNFYQ